ncbi:MAG TPA: ABC transporter permease [Rhodocyclaceae bacterium]|nr:ABC transporter permease [Rhodocyclaceae bacterium]
MNFQVLILWSDILVWLMFATLFGFAWLVARSAPLLSAWQRVGASSSGMAAATVLAAFALIGLLDSFHYRPQLPAQPGEKPAYAVEALSLLDAALMPLRTRVEKTYSAPMATHLYAKEMIELPDGSRARDFPRLRHGGAHLGPDVAAWDGDITMRLARGLLLALLVWVGVAGALTGGIACRRRISLRSAWQAIWRRQHGLAWNAVLLTLGALCFVLLPMACLADSYHVLGTDKVGQDVFYLVLKSVRTALIIGLVTTLVMLPMAILLGIAAGYFRGWIDDLIQYLYTVLNSIPGVLLIAAAVLMMQVVIDTHPQWFSTAAERADLRLLALCFILGVTSWTSLCRLLRGETLKLRELEYIQAARSFGVSDLRIILRHILPNMMHIVIIAVVMDFSGLVLSEAVLSYVGIGVDPSMISFGTMINNARLELGREPVVWWSLLAAFVFMFVLVLAANLFADAVRDAFDPRMA